MQKTIDLLHNLEWFLKPISIAFQFLFTTTTGIVLLAILLFFYVFIYTADTIWERRLLYSGKRLPSAEGMFVFWKGIAGALSNFIAKVPVLLGIFLIMALITGLFNSMNQLDKYVQNQQKIKELKSVIRQLDQRFKVAEVKVVEQIYSEALNSTTTTLEIKYFDDFDTGNKPQSQNITLKGNDIYFDAIMINFEYSEISESGVKNIAIPYRIFSNEVPQDKAIMLNIRDEEGVPFYFKRKNKQIYGLSPDDFKNSVNNLVQMIKDEESARKMGIRSFYGNAVHQRMYEGSVYQIWIEQSGGIVLRNMTIF